MVDGREQERIAKAEAARRETERILREQQAEVDAKKADMVKRDIQREKVGMPSAAPSLLSSLLLHPFASRRPYSPTKTGAQTLALTHFGIASHALLALVVLQNTRFPASHVCATLSMCKALKPPKSPEGTGLSR